MIRINPLFRSILLKLGIVFGFALIAGVPSKAWASRTALEYAYRAVICYPTPSNCVAFTGDDLVDQLAYVGLPYYIGVHCDQTNGFGYCGLSNSQTWTFSDTEGGYLSGPYTVSDPDNWYYVPTPAPLSGLYYNAIETDDLELYTVMSSTSGQGWVWAIAIYYGGGY
jgi:hypothetical protein